MTKPFIKWVGGKRQLLPELDKYLPTDFKNYYEPFIGGGGLLFHLQPTQAVINDFNGELTNTYCQVKYHPKELIALLSRMFECDSKEYYLDVRAWDRQADFHQRTQLERAARFIYLNKAGFNGLWRVNSKGQNNVPYGYRKNLHVDAETILDDSQYLHDHDIKIMTGDYCDVLKIVKPKSLVYLDPPYLPVTSTASFTGYTKDGFGLEQQKTLRDWALKLAKERQVKVMLSNADVPLLYDLYSDPIFHIHQVRARRNINSNGNKRGPVGEVIITTYDCGDQHD